VEFRVKKGEVPASISSQCSIGVVSAARLGAKVAAPPVVVQLVAAPSSRMTLGSSSSGDALCPTACAYEVEAAENATKSMSHLMQRC
jgi:hypothetical protein